MCVRLPIMNQRDWSFWYFLLCLHHSVTRIILCIKKFKTVCFKILPTCCLQLRSQLPVVRHCMFNICSLNWFVKQLHQEALSLFSHHTRDGDTSRCLVPNLRRKQTILATCGSILHFSSTVLWHNNDIHAAGHFYAVKLLIALCDCFESDYYQMPSDVKRKRPGTLVPAESQSVPVVPTPWSFLIRSPIKVYLIFQRIFRVQDGLRNRTVEYLRRCVKYNISLYEVSQKNPN